MRHHRVNQQYVGVPKREKEAERISGDIMAGNSPNLVKHMNIKIEEVQPTPTLRQIIIKLLKARDKARILKAARKK